MSRAVIWLAQIDSLRLTGTDWVERSHNVALILTETHTLRRQLTSNAISHARRQISRREQRLWTFLRSLFFHFYFFIFVFGPTFYCTPSPKSLAKEQNLKKIQNVTHCHMARTNWLTQIDWHRLSRTFPLKVTSLLYLIGNKTNLKHQRRASPEDMWISQQLQFQFFYKFFLYRFKKGFFIYSFKVFEYLKIYY